MIMHALETYLALRRAMGFDLRDTERQLRHFARFAAARGESHVHTQTVLDWAALAPSPTHRARRLNMVILFARAVCVEDARHEVPPAHVFGKPSPRRRAPFLYAPEEMQRLLAAAARLGPAGSWRPHVYTTLLALLATTGLRISEALALRLEDITVAGLVIRHTKFRKSRLVPLHATAVAALDRYLRQRQQWPSREDHLFIARHGGLLRYPAVQATFLRLARTIGLRAAPGQPGPRLHDLRHTFAVRALERCPHEPGAISRHMVALSTYLGHTCVTDTYWYLHTTPQLLTDIATACEAFITGETL